MEYLLTASQMQRFDQNTIVNIGIPSAVLMERAALAVTEEIKNRFSAEKTVLVVAGKGNNGGDGLAIARLLLLLGYHVDTYLAWDTEKSGSEENTRQRNILEKCGGSFVDDPEFSAYDVIVDALFGIGLSRPLTSPYDNVIEKINASDAYVVAVDLPSGIHTDTGMVLGCAVQADLTVTFGYLKKGHILYPGNLYCGEIIKRDVGIYHDASLFEEKYCFSYKDCEEQILPERKPYGNKGTFGKLLIIAGSKDTAGAAVLAAKAAFAMGIGMVRLVIHKEQKDVILYHVPECMVDTYKDDTTQEELYTMLEKAASWCDGILIGPGIGMNDTTKSLVEFCLGQNNLPIVFDADALNILSKYKEPFFKMVTEHDGNIIMTPHMGEFARLLDVSVGELKEHKEAYSRSFAKELDCTLVCKDARTFVACKESLGMYINQSGNDGMATAGSGDVLSGIAAVFMLQEENSFEAASHAVYLHGLAGDLCAAEIGKRSTKASDLTGALEKIIKKIEVN